MWEARDADFARPADHAELQALLVIVVVAVLRVDDPDVHVERPGQKGQLVDREARDADGAHRHAHAVHQRVRPVHARPVIAVDVDSEDRVRDPARIAEADLDDRGPARFEDGTLVAIGAEHARAGDLDLLRAPARADLAARAAPALPLLPHL